MPKTRPTQAERWLAAGHRYDDVSQWRELCELLEARGLTPTSAVPAHLAPLLFRDPENTYLGWLREQMLVPVIHLRGRAKQAGNGWRVRRDWRDRLAVMADPTPEVLLLWWRQLEPKLRAMCLKRTENATFYVHDQSVPDSQLRAVSGTAAYECTLCMGDSWDDDPRGILHTWHGKRHDADCPLVRLHLKIRAAYHPSGHKRAQAALADALQRLAEEYALIGHGYEAKFWRALDAHDWRDSAESAGLRRPAWAAFHVAQICAVWTEPTRTDIGANARYLRSCGHWPHGTGLEDYQRRVVDLYAEAATRLEALLA